MTNFKEQESTEPKLSATELHQAVESLTISLKNTLKQSSEFRASLLECFFHDEPESEYRQILPNWEKRFFIPFTIGSYTYEATFNPYSDCFIGVSELELSREKIESGEREFISIHRRKDPRDPRGKEKLTYLRTQEGNQVLERHSETQTTIDKISTILTDINLAP